MMENGEWNGQEQRKRKTDLREDKEGDKLRPHGWSRDIFGAARA
jgi:hypothetical protein